MQADRVCLKLAGVDAIDFLDPGTNRLSADTDPSSVPYCRCKQSRIANGPGAIHDVVPRGDRPAKQGFSFFPVTCDEDKCACSAVETPPPKKKTPEPRRGRNPEPACTSVLTSEFPARHPARWDDGERELPLYGKSCALWTTEFVPRGNRTAGMRCTPRGCSLTPWDAKDVRRKPNC